MHDVDTIVVGGGVIGLAVAARLSHRGEVMVLERESAIGQGTSSRNSEVIHAGIYYTQPLKAELCVRGKALLYEYCLERHIPHNNLGKLIVAVSQSEQSQLETIYEQAEANGVHLEVLSKQQVSRIEPEVSAYAGLLSPSTGIVSAHELMLSLEGDLHNAGGQVVTHCEVLSVVSENPGFKVVSKVEGETFEVTCKNLILAAGLSAQELVTQSIGLPSKVPKLYPCKGRYFSYGGKAPFSRLIYPVPDPNTVGLGVHATLDLSGRVKFGPDTEYVQTLDYSMPEEVPDEFVAAIERYFPNVNKHNFSPDYAGIRPKISAAGDPSADFVIDGKNEHGIDGYVQLFGIESPGLTASLAIAEYVERVL